MAKKMVAQIGDTFAQFGLVVACRQVLHNGKVHPDLTCCACLFTGRDWNQQGAVSGLRAPDIEESNL